jgi:H+/Cl- antiporter ClcA
VVFLIMGGFLVVAAWQSRAAQAKGLGGALEALEAQPFGWVLLAVTAAGLFAFGVFSFVEAFYRRIDAPDLDDAKDAISDGLRNLGS